MKHTLIIFLFMSCAIMACNSKAKQVEKTRDSLEMEKVDQMVLDQDSLIKAKEKELMEKYK